MRPLGYDRPLAILPFDHRTSIARGLLHTEGLIDNKTKGAILELKKIIYEGFLLSLKNGVSKDEAAVLIDEEYGQEIILDAKKMGAATLLTVEKSGVADFEFEFGDKFGEHLKSIGPTFAKALIRLPQGGVVSERTTEQLKKLSDFCRTSEIRLLIEIVAIKVFPDEKDRLANVINVMSIFQNNGIEPDVWKVEGFISDSSYKKIVSCARNINQRKSVGVVVLGGGEDINMVNQWIVASRGIQGIIGIAVGRTVFFEPLKKFLDKTYSKKEAISEISSSYTHFWNLFKGRVQ